MDFQKHYQKLLDVVQARLGVSGYMVDMSEPYHAYMGPWIYTYPSVPSRSKTVYVNVGFPVDDDFAILGMMAHEIGHLHGEHDELAATRWAVDRGFGLENIAAMEWQARQATCSYVCREEVASDIATFRGWMAKAKGAA